jgi:bla regulator protein blaR1
MIVSVPFNGLWQGMLVVVLTALILRLVPTRDAATRYAAWLLALLAVAVMPIVTAAHVGAQLFASLPFRAGLGSGTFSLVRVGVLADAGRWLAWPHLTGSSALTTAIALVWLAGAVAALARLAVSFARIARIRRTATAFCRAGGVPVVIATDITIPIATGVISPAIVLPADIAEASSANDLRCMIEHELAHVRRGDVVTNAAQRIIEALLFWNPWVHLIGRRLVGEREAACDDCAVTRIGESGRYVRSLAALGRRMNGQSISLLTPTAAGSHNALVARIERLTDDRSPSDPNLNYVALGAVATIFAAMSLAFQAILQAPASASTLYATPSVVAATGGTCKEPNADATVVNPAAPRLPKSQWPSHSVSAVMAVTVSAGGKPTSVLIRQSSGNANVDRAVGVAAEKSTYSPKRVNCVAVEGSYLFKAEFGP